MKTVLLVDVENRGKFCIFYLKIWKSSVAFIHVAEGFSFFTFWFAICFSL
jgi:hypothetical protein